MKTRKADSLALHPFICEEEVLPEQQERSPSLVQEEPEPRQIKEEQEELWISQGGEQLQGLEEADVIKFTFNPVPVKSEHDDENPQSSWFNQSQDTEETLQIKEEQEELFQDLEEADGLHPVKHDCDNTMSSQLGQSQDPELLQIKDEPHQGLEEADHSKITVDPVKWEYGQENFLPFQLLQTEREKNREAYSLPSTSTEQMKIEPDGEDCGISEPASNIHPAGDLEPTRYGQPLSSDSSGTETDNSNGWKESGGPLDLTRKPKKVQKRQSLSNSRPGFSKKGDLKRLIRNHTGDKPFSCSVCEKGFSWKGDLKRHMITHSGEKRFSCSVCEKEFSWKGDLKTHMRTHTGEKPFNCSGCGKGFSDQGNLRRHMVTHTGERPFSCSVCGKGFSWKGDLKRHVRTHTGEKPFSCPFCEKGFCQRANLKKHTAIHTRDKPFNCLVCGKGIRKKERLILHMKTHSLLEATDNDTNGSPQE